MDESIALLEASCGEFGQVKETCVGATKIDMSLERLDGMSNSILGGNVKPHGVLGFFFFGFVLHVCV